MMCRLLEKSSYLCIFSEWPPLSLICILDYGPFIYPWDMSITIFFCTKFRQCATQCEIKNHVKKLVKTGKRSVIMTICLAASFHSHMESKTVLSR